MWKHLRTLINVFKNAVNLFLTHLIIFNADEGRKEAEMEERRAKENAKI